MTKIDKAKNTGQITKGNAKEVAGKPAGDKNLEAEGKEDQMKGNVKLTFDGMTHMIGSSSLDTTTNGKTTHMDSTSDYRWKGPTCNPSADMNLKFKRH